MLTPGQCSSLSRIFGNSTVINQQSSAYDAFTNSYWSVQQASVDPYCIFKPSNAEAVSIVILLSRLTRCPFAVKSGGHAAFAGASNVESGITVSLENLKDISLSENKEIASIEPGNVWYDIYTNLETQNLAVIGGRVSTLNRERTFSAIDYKTGSGYRRRGTDSWRRYLLLLKYLWMGL
jgi:FAD/FMN-containing dehydrogenase